MSCHQTKAYNSLKDSVIILMKSNHLIATQGGCTWCGVIHT